MIPIGCSIYPKLHPQPTHILCVCVCVCIYIYIRKQPTRLVFLIYMTSEDGTHIMFRNVVSKRISCKNPKKQIKQILKSKYQRSLEKCVCAHYDSRCTAHAAPITCYFMQEIPLRFLYVLYRALCKLLKKKRTNVLVLYLFSLIYSHLHVSAFIRPSTGCSILKSTISYNACTRPRCSF